MFNKPGGVLYIGFTNDIVRRVWEHKQRINPRSFTAQYNCVKLGFYTSFSDVCCAIEYEKRLKAGKRAAKIKAIESMNPNWDDLALE